MSTFILVPQEKMIIILTLTLLFTTPSLSTSISKLPTPTPWPEQFHSFQIINVSGTLQLFNYWYDYPNGRSLGIQQDQLSNNVRYELEWDNGTSFYYTLDSNKMCKTPLLPVRFSPPDWLKEAKYIGQVHFDGFHCNAWEIVDFITFYEDVVTKKPVYWRFYTGVDQHVMTFEVGEVLEDSKWQAPEYCFKNKNEKEEKLSETFVL